jgi:succinyl-CoA synthetase alpha subunit
MAILVDRGTRVVVQGITGREASMVVRHSLDYGTQVVAGVTPGKRGEFIHGVPVFDTVRQAVKETGANTALVYVPPAAVYDAVLEDVDSAIGLVVIVTERIPQHDTARFLRVGRQSGSLVVGPNVTGILCPMERVKVGPMGGDNPSRCFVPGTVGVISRSGGMAAECAWMVKRAGYGISTAVSVGGDALIGTTPSEALALFQQDAATAAVVMWSEPGTAHEENVADFLQAGGFTKPLLVYVAGRFMEDLPEGTVFGHAASIIQGDKGRPSVKMARLRGAGALVAETFGDLVPMLKESLGA